jgi:hypothetical protein
MKSESIEKNLLRFLLFGSATSTLALTPWWSTDPVNLMKMVCLSTAAFALLLSFVIPNMREILKRDRFVTVLILLFSVQASIAALSSSDSTAQNFYGVFGRNTGFLTYFSLCILFLASSQLTQLDSLKKILRILFFCGLVNLLYCLSVAFGYDPIPWSNIYRAPLGTFGNPNFIGAFLGFIFVLCFVHIIQSSTSRATRFLIFILLIALAFAIHKTGAFQGIVVSLIGVTFTFFLYLRSKNVSKIFMSSYVFLISTMGILGVMGALQIGPLSSLVYKSSVSLRGIYWTAGLKTGLANFWLGAGMDSYGTWFRRSRDIAKLGPDTATNSSHNVFLDIFASGGIILAFIYLILTAYVGALIFKHIKNFRNYDPTFVSLSSIWICYQAQSLISINQIGLAVWGWLLGGLIVAYMKLNVDKVNERQVNSSKKVKVKSTEVAASTVLLSIGGAVIGFGLALPPFLADANWRGASVSKDKDVIENALHQWPRDPVRYTNGLIVFLQNNLQGESYRIAKEATLEFPNDYYSWYNLGIIPGISDSEKSEVEKQLKRLDPNNPKRPW